MEEQIREVLTALYGDNSKHFEINRAEGKYIVRVNPDMYQPDSFMKEHLSYIHIEPGLNEGEYTAQLFCLDIRIGEKSKVSSVFRGGLYEVLKPMQPTLLNE